MYVVEIEPKDEISPTPTVYHFEKTNFMWNFLDFVIKNGKGISIRITTEEKEGGRIRWLKLSG